MAKRPKFQAPSGMHDILPEDQVFFQKIYSVASNIAHFYGFQRIDTPILEEAELFSKGIGLIDCAIIISARRHHAKIWTLDKKLNNILEEEEKFVYSIQPEDDLS